MTPLFDRTGAVRGLRAAPRYLSSTLAVLGSDEQAQLLVLAVVIGAAAALAVIAFYYTIDVVQRLVLDRAVRATRATLLVPLSRSPLVSRCVDCWCAGARATHPAKAFQTSCTGSA